MGRKRTLAADKNAFLQPLLCALSSPMQPPRNRFTPVQLKARHDGWSPGRQRCFIEELAATRSVSKACRAVGMSRDSAYKLRGRPEAAQFRLAWNQALEPYPAAERRRSPRAVQRLKRLEQRRKADEVNEMDGPPISPAPGTSALSALSASSALSTLEVLLAQLRAQDLQPPFDGA